MDNSSFSLFILLLFQLHDSRRQTYRLQKYAFFISYHTYAHIFYQPFSFILSFLSEALG